MMYYGLAVRLLAAIEHDTASEAATNHANGQANGQTNGSGESHPHLLAYTK
jgi:hypothetical protein